MPKAPRPVDERAIEARLEATVLELVQELVAEIPKPKDGEPGPPGRDVDPEAVAALETRLAMEVASRVDYRVLEAAKAIPVPKDGRPGRDAKDGAPGPAGKRGPPGPMGPMPRHEWRFLADGAVELRFQMAPGVWGEWSENLRGPRGFMSGGGGGGFTVIDGGGGNGTGAGVGMAYPWFLH